ncbi:TonB family protein [Aurantiacibacter aquimixticola]|uniref:TonB family protein n=2 Tax=Aurantiacibacter aquimixticola TaxID=1958945 RepID=A0A419RU61_9SPHN|nr:TonB family protein [Aurantiacibacter aquimixticola]
MGRVRRDSICGRSSFGKGRMINMSNFTEYFIPFAAAAMATTMPAYAQDAPTQADGEIIIEPSQERVVYAQRVSRQLDRNLARHNVPLRTDASGIVRVRFTADGNGRAHDVEVMEDSGSRFLERAAIWAVSRLSDIAPTFAHDPAGQRMQANIVFANSWTEGRRLTRQLEEEEAARLASQADDDEHVLALNIGTSVRR